MTHRAANLEAMEDATALKVQKTRLISEEPVLSDKCLEQMVELQEVKMLNEHKINELDQLYTKPVWVKFFAIVMLVCPFLGSY